MKKESKRKRDEEASIDTSTKIVIDEVISPTRARVSFPSDSEKRKKSVPVAKKPVLKVHPIEAVLDNPLDIREVTNTPSEQEWSNSNGKVRNEYVGDTLTKRQELFCQLYATDTEFFGNGVQAYLEIYDIDREKPNWYKTACAATSQLLSNIKVCHRINDLLSE